MNAENTKVIASYLEGKPEMFQKIAGKLKDIILASNYDMGVEIRWGKLTFGLMGDYHHWICAIQILKNKVTLTFHFGGLLQDENNRLISGTSKFLRKIEYDNVENIDEEEIRSFIQKAVDKLPYFKENWKEINKNN